jgi:hypothetical protein
MTTLMAPQPCLTLLVTFSTIFCMCDSTNCLQLVKTDISINAKEAQPNDDPNQKPFCNITYVFSWDTAGQACCTMAVTELQCSEKRSPIYRLQLVKPVQLKQGNRMVCLHTSARQSTAINLVPMSALPIPNDHTM